MEIYLLRHGRTTAPKAYIGSTDVALSDEGEAQVGHTAAFLDAIDFDCCYCSPLQRCRRTLQLLELTVPAQIAPELREIDFGEWEGRTFDEINRQSPEHLDVWQKQGDRFSFPGGENISAFQTRITGWLDRLVRSEHRSVLLITHAGVIRTALCALLKLPHDNAFRFMICEAGVSLVSYRDEFGMLEYLNRGVVRSWA